MSSCIKENVVKVSKKVSPENEKVTSMRKLNLNTDKKIIETKKEDLEKIDAPKPKYKKILCENRRGAKVCQNTPLKNGKLNSLGDQSNRQDIQLENLKDSRKGENLKENCIQDGSQVKKVVKMFENCSNFGPKLSQKSAQSAQIAVDIASTSQNINYSLFPNLEKGELSRRRMSPNIAKNRGQNQHNISKMSQKTVIGDKIDFAADHKSGKRKFEEIIETQNDRKNNSLGWNIRLKGNQQTRISGQLNKNFRESKRQKCLETDLEVSDK